MKTRLKKRGGYTLLELLISILIFSGIIILALAAFARSAASSTKSNAVRDQVQAARLVIDKFTTDLHYIDTTDPATSYFSTCGAAGKASYTGLRLSPTVGCDETELLIKYPGATGAGDLVWRLYVAQTVNNRPSIYLYEQRGCSVAGSAVTCGGTMSGPSDLLSSNYSVDGVGGVNPTFSGVDVNAANLAKVSPYVKVNFTIKPASAVAQTCAQLSPGDCYTLSTTVIPGNK